jgi:hypothetical protein
MGDHFIVVSGQAELGCMEDQQIYFAIRGFEDLEESDSVPVVVRFRDWEINAVWTTMVRGEGVFFEPLEFRQNGGVLRMGIDTFVESGGLLTVEYQGTIVEVDLDGLSEVIYDLDCYIAVEFPDHPDDLEGEEE